MEDGTSQSFLGSLIKNLSSALSDQPNQPNQPSIKDNNSNILDGVMNDLDWMENSSHSEDQDIMNSMNFHKRILDSEISTIDKELDSILKDADTADYLISLLKKRQKLETQVHQIEENLNVFEQQD